MSHAGALLAVLGTSVMCMSDNTAIRPGFELKVGESPWGISSLKVAGRPALEFVRPKSTIGDVLVRCRAGSGEWQEFRSAGAATSCDMADSKLDLAQEFGQAGDRILWSLSLTNAGQASVEVGDLALGLPMFNNYTKNTKETFERRIFRHAFIGGEGSWLYWQPAGGGGPYLIMSACPATGLEFFTNNASDYAWGGGDYRVYIHSAAYADTEKRGTWRPKHTSVILKPGELKTYSFAFNWADSIDAVRRVITDEGGLDVRVAPAMTVPRDERAMLALRSADRIDSVSPEFPKQTSVKPAGKKAGYSLYAIEFKKLGENLLTIDRGGRKTIIEFFVTQPIESVIKKRAAFIVANQQHRDPSKWYDGLFSLWDVRQSQGKHLLGPDNLGGQYAYAVSGSDDPSNSKAVFLSEKNVAYPDPKEIEALEYYLQHFVWGKLQRTDKETPHPYGV